MASEVNHHVGYSRENECWFVRFYPYQTEQQANEAAAAFTRPAPAATDTGLVTVKWPYQKTFNAIGAAVKIQGDAKAISVQAFIEAFGDELVTRSQAEELLAAERADLDRALADYRRCLVRITELQADNAAKDAECKAIEATLNAWFDTKKITEDSLKPLMVAAVKGYLRTCLSGGMPQELIDEVLPAVECMIDYGVFTESVTQYTMSLKADNAAKDARIKELDHENNCWMKSAIKQQKRSKALEAKLAVAEKDAATWEANFKALNAKYARAVLGGKPS